MSLILLFFLIIAIIGGIKTSKSIKETFNRINNQGAFNVPNQLIQKPHNEDKNLCPACNKRELCQDYKILKYSDDCDQYQRGLVSDLSINNKQRINLSQTEVKISIDLETRLTNECQNLKFDKGTRTLDSLKCEIKEVKDLFKNATNVNDKFIDVDKTKKITEDIYNKSLSFLSLALDIYKQIGISNYDTLKKETEELQNSLSNLNVDSVSYKLIKSAIDKNTNMLELIKKKRDRIDELFAQVSLCKDAIMEIRMGLPELLNHQSMDDVEKLITDGKDRVGFGQRLLEEFKVQGL
jgi:hypothetical protein